MSPVLASATVQLILPLVSAWVKCQEASILRNGVPLTSSLQADASRLGIKHAQRVRLRAIDQVPGGMPRWLRALVTPLGLCSPLTSGMSLRYGIFIRSDAWGDRRLVRHELVHTLQYERLGGIW